MEHDELLDALERGAVLVTVNRRLALYYRDLYDARALGQGREVWDSPDIAPWGAWLERVHDLALLLGAEPVEVLLSEDQELALWERIVAESERGSGLLHPAGTAALCVEARRIALGWRLPMSADGSALTDEAATFIDWSQAFERRCQKHGWLDLARLPDRVADGWRVGTVPAPGEVMLAGFDELSPQQESVLTALKACGARVHHMRPDAPGSALRVPLRDATEELTAAGRWARARLERDPEPRLAIIVPQLGALRAQMVRILDSVLQPTTLLPEGFSAPRLYNVSLGCPLSEYPLVKAALGVLGLDAWGVPLPELSALLRSPYLGGDGEAARRAMFDAHLREAREPELALARVVGAARQASATACPDLAARLRAVRSELDGVPARQAPSEWATHFSRCLDAVGWPGDRALDSPEYQTVVAWREQLYAFGGLDAVRPEMDRQAALEKLTRMAGATIFEPKGEPAPIQVLGLLEAAGERFDAVWVMGLHDGVWPAPARPNPLLPYALQRQRRVPHASAERELAFARAVTDRLLSAAPEVVFSHPRREGDADLRGSPLIAHLPEVPPDDFGLAGHEPYADILFGARACQTVADSAGPELTGPVPGGARLLLDQSACPFRAFANHRLAASALEKPARGLEPLDRGILVHRALEHLWGRLESWESLQGTTEEGLVALTREAASAAVEEQVRRRPGVFTERFTEIERERLQGILQDWLAEERQREPFTVLVQEREQSIQLGRIRLTARTDRIDRLDDGSVAVIDYKTGLPRVQSWDGERPEDPQLPLYAVAAREALSGVLFARVRRGKMGFLGLGKRAVAPGVVELPAGDFDATIDGWRAVLEDLADQVAEGQAAVAPRDEKACKYCGLDPLCRIAEVGRPPEAEDEP